MTDQSMPTTIFEAERASALRATVIRALTERPVAYNGKFPSLESADKIMLLTIPDSTKRYLMELWTESKRRQEDNDKSR